MSLPQRLRLSAEVRDALERSLPVVALETAVATHGLPSPFHLQALVEMEAEVRSAGAIPAICLAAGGALCVGATPSEVEAVANDPHRQKASVRDLGLVLASGASAGLTVSATLLAATRAGIRVFATGGIGGVHLDAGSTRDVSADLPQLARSPVVTVCAGAKSVLDISGTLEELETLGVPVCAYGSDEFPAFYLRSSGVRVPRLDDPAQIAAAARDSWELGHEAALVVGNPLPPDEALDPTQWNEWIDRAQREAAQDRVRGKDVTPYLLDKVAGYSHGQTVRANLDLLRRNARLAGQVAAALCS